MCQDDIKMKLWSESGRSTGVDQQLHYSVLNARLYLLNVHVHLCVLSLGCIYKPENCAESQEEMSHFTQGRGWGVGSEPSISYKKRGWLIALSLKEQLNRRLSRERERRPSQKPKWEVRIEKRERERSLQQAVKTDQSREWPRGCGGRWGWGRKGEADDPVWRMLSLDLWFWKTNLAIAWRHIWGGKAGKSKASYKAVDESRGEIEVQTQAEAASEKGRDWLQGHPGGRRDGASLFTDRM